MIQTDPTQIPGYVESTVNRVLPGAKEVDTGIAIGVAFSFDI